MAEFIIWLMVSGLVMIALYGVYGLLLSRQRQPSFNRAVLLAIYAAAFMSPFVFRLFASSASPSAAVEVVAVESVSKADMNAAAMWMKVLLAVYAAGVTVIVMRRLWGQICLMRIIARGEKIERDGYVIVISDDASMATFSWRKYIVMNRADYEDGAEMVIAHELSHLGHRHWIDLLVADTVLAVQWFNPAAWMMRDELKDIHEFQADDQVVAQGFERQAYQLMLISKAVGRKVSFVGNSLNHGKLKRRLAMMKARRQGRSSKSRAAIMIPVLALLAVAVNSNAGKGLCRTIVRVEEFDTEKTFMIGPGENKPAIYVDGDEIESPELENIDPSTIKSISVRKDNSDNGTIYITTK